MRTSNLTQTFKRGSSALLALGLAVITNQAQAAPYATEVQESGGVVSFTLNESADSVKVIFGSTTNDLGALAKGSYSTNVSAVGTVFVEVFKNGGLGWRSPSGSNFTHTVNGVPVPELWAGRNQISEDTNLLTRFNLPRGVAVNQNPASPSFGRVYVANAGAGSTGGRTLGDGLYVMKSDLSDSPLGYGDTAQGPGMTTWGLTTSAPWLLSIGADDNIYVADFGDASSVVPRINPDLTVGERVLDYAGGPGTLLAPTNHGSTKKIATTGTLAGGDLVLYTLDEDYTGDCMNTPTSSKNSIWRYDILSGPLTNTSCGTVVGVPTPSWTVTGTQDFIVATNGYIYATQNRSGGLESGLYVMDAATGFTLWNSRAAYQAITGNFLDNDVLVNIHSVAISPDGKYLALNTLSIGPGLPAGGSDCWIIPLNAGIPDLASRMLLDAGSVSQGRGVAFDAAGNLYTISSGETILRVWSPGGSTTAKTGTDGTFSVTLPSTEVSVTAGAATINEGSSTAITITRAGDTSAPLSVNYSLSGTATSGADYTSLGTSVVLGTGESSTNLTLSALADGLSEVTETVVLSIGASPNYTIGSPASAIVSILDLDTPVIRVADDAPTMYERHTNDFATVKLERLGDLSGSLSVEANNLTFAGTAVLNTDYIILSNTFPVNLDPGITSSNIAVVSPLDNGSYAAAKTIIVGSTAGVGFSGSSSNTTLRILDDENPPGVVLYSNPLTSAGDAVNWNVTYANGDMVALGSSDYEAAFGYDLTTSPGGVIASPPGGATTALRLTVNKSVANNAGVNVYPTNVSFSGNYAVRFNMNIITDEAAGTTHGPLFGINHNGTQTNWWAGSGISTTGGNITNWASDGIWYWISADGGAGAGDYILHTGLGGSLPNTGWERPIAAGFNDNFTKVFKGPPAPFSGYAGPGLVANDPPALAADNSNWSDVEIRQLGGVVTLFINKSRVLTYTNTTTFTSGTVMLGYDDPFNSVGLPAGAAYFANLSVVSLAGPVITKITRTGSAVEIDFTSSDGNDVPGSFTLLGASLVTGPYTSVVGAAIVQLPDGSFRATATSTADTQFYRIQRN